MPPRQVERYLWPSMPRPVRSRRSRPRQPLERFSFLWSSTLLVPSPGAYPTAMVPPPITALNSLLTPSIRPRVSSRRPEVMGHNRLLTRISTPSTWCRTEGSAVGGTGNCFAGGVWSHSTFASHSLGDPANTYPVVQNLIARRLYRTCPRRNLTRSFSSQGGESSRSG